MLIVLYNNIISNSSTLHEFDKIMFIYDFVYVIDIYIEHGLINGFSIIKMKHSPKIDCGLGLFLGITDSSFETDLVSFTVSVNASIPIWSWSLLLRYFDKVFSFLQLSQVNSDPSTISKFLGFRCPEHLEQRKHLLWYSLWDTSRRWARYTGRPHAAHLSRPVLPNLIGAYKVV